MTAPALWLVRPVAIGAVEEDLAACGAPDLWLRQWRAFLGRSIAEDELWEYSGEPTGPDIEWSGLHAGFALVREGEVFDWIESPPSIA